VTLDGVSVMPRAMPTHTKKELISANATHVARKSVVQSCSDRHASPQKLGEARAPADVPDRIVRASGIRDRIANGACEPVC